jgi:3-hydroxy-D-aspartate aldolase
MPAGGGPVSMSAPILVRLAQRIADASHLKLRGVQAYHGPSQHLRGYAERKTATAEAARRAREARDLIVAAGLSCPVISGAGTGTFEFAATSGIYTELQPGSYIFMDADYARNRGQNEKPFSAFRQSLFVLTTVVSSPGGGRAMVDAGHKSLPVDSGLPLVFGRDDVAYSRPADEAGLLTSTTNAPLPKVGERLLLIPSHCDPTVNLHDWYVCVRKGQVEALWSVDARGAIH